VNEIQSECSLSPIATETLEEQAAAILGLYSGDAVYAAKKTHIYCFEPIEEAIFNELFGTEWEVELTHNELALTLVRTLDDFMEDLETFLDEVMVQRAVEAQISSSINFYIRCMLRKSSLHKDGKKSCFADNAIAVTRMRGDTTVMREYFDGLAETMPTLERVIEKEFTLLESVIELVSIAAGVSKSNAHDFILVLQKRVRNIGITKFVVGDLYHLVNPQEERSVYELIEGMEEEMTAVAPNDEQAATSAQGRNTVPGLRTDEMMAKHCDESKRNRPLKAGGLERAENALNLWRNKPKTDTGEKAGLLWKTKTAPKTT
jgi:Exocyst complex component Sec6